MRRFSEHGNFSVAPAEILDSKHGSVIVNNIFAYLTFSLSATQVNKVKEWCWFSQFNVFRKYFPSRIDVLFLFTQFYNIHVHK